MWAARTRVVRERGTERRAVPKNMMVTACHREAATGQKGNVGVKVKRVRVADSSPVTARAAQGAVQRPRRDSAETPQCTRALEERGAWSVKQLGSRSRSKRVQV